MAKLGTGIVPITVMLLAGSSVGAKGCLFTDDVSLGDGDGVAGTADAGGFGGAPTSGGKNSQGGVRAKGGASARGGSVNGGDTASAGSTAIAGNAAATSGGSNATSGGTLGSGGSPENSAGGGQSNSAGAPETSLAGAGGAGEFEPPPECLLPFEHQTCGLGYAPWGYDADARACVQYPLDDCGGNANWFKSRQDCEARCLPPAPPPPDPCTLPIEPGTCDGSIPRFAYDAQTRRCLQFVYGGCEGNTNNFETLDECRLVCRAYDEQTCPISLLKVRGSRYQAADGCWQQNVYVDCVGLYTNSTSVKGCVSRLYDGALFDVGNSAVPLSDYRQCSAAESELLLGLPACG